MKRAFYIGIIVILAAVLIYGRPLIRGKFFSTSISQGFMDFKAADNGLEQRIAELEKENEELRIQILNQKAAPANTAKVYSSYPFNNKKDIMIAAGSNNRVKKGDVITYGQNVLVGKVKEVSAYSSVVTTIYDPNWEIAVRIGEGQTDALFRGGNEPLASLIPKDAEVSPGQLVLAAGQGFPYGLEIGQIKEVRFFPGNPFKEAVVEPKVNLNEIKDVSIYH